MVVQDRDHVGPAAELVVVDVADVRAPELVAPACGEGHLLPLLGRPLGLLEAVKLAVEGEDAPAGPGAEVYADLGEGRVDAVLAEVGVSLEAPDRLDGLQRYLPDTGRPAVRPVLQTCGPLLGPALEDPVDGRPTDPEVARSP